jgi:hypothetical protein
MDIIFQTHPDIVIAGNTFRNVRTIIQFEDVPLLEVDNIVPAGFTTQFAVYNSDGIKIAKVKGSQIYPTENIKAKLTDRHEPNLTVFELDGKPILELRRLGAAAIHGWAELYTPTGTLIKANDNGVSGLLRSGGDVLVMGNKVLKDSLFENCDIGIHVRQNSITLGEGGGSVHIGYLGPLNKLP